MTATRDPPDARVLAKLRAICLALPEAHEADSFGHPCWRVNKKTFACYEAYDGEWCVNFKTTVLDQQRLVASSDAYFVAPYTGRFGWVCVRQRSIDWGALRPMLIGSYRMNAPKRLAALLDAGS
jgi:hypothetical protein